MPNQKRVSVPNAVGKKISTSSFKREQIDNDSREKRSQTLPLSMSDISPPENDLRTFAPDIIIERNLSTEDTELEDDDNDVVSGYLQIEEAPNVRVYAKQLSDRLSRSVDNINSWLNYGLIPTYEYESPDEGALVKAATYYGYKLANRTLEQIFFTTPSGDIKIFDILQVLQFDSTRKRNVYYCKGQFREYQSLQ